MTDSTPAPWRLNWRCMLHVWARLAVIVCATVVVIGVELRLDRLERKLDHQSDQLSDMRVALATQSGQLDRILSLLPKGQP